MTGWEHEGPCDCPSGEGHRVDRNYCEHGTFVGDPYGPDYMCHWCEDGISDADYAAIMAARERERRRVAALSPALARLVDRTWAHDLSDDDTVRVVSRIVRMSRWGVRLPLDYHHPEA